MLSFVGVLARARPVTLLTTVLPQFSTIIASTTRDFATKPAIKGKAPPPPSKGKKSPKPLPKGTPAKGSKVTKATPAKATPAKGTPAKGTPIKGTPAKGVPVKGSTAKGAPVKAAAPVKGASVSASNKEREKLKAAKQKEKEAQDKERERRLKEKERLAAAQEREKEKEKQRKEKEREKLDKHKEAEKDKKEAHKKIEAEKREKEKEKAAKLKLREKEDNEKAAARQKREEEKRDKAERPKRSISGYFFYASEVRQELAAKNPSLKITELAKEIGTRWGTLSPEQKKKYEDLAAADKERYAKEMKSYEIKHPRPPKRPLSSFIVYVREVHDKVRQQNPDATQPDLVSIIGKKWKTLSAEQKKPFEKTAAASKEKWLKERKAFEESQA